MIESLKSMCLLSRQLIRRGRSIWSDADHLPGEHALIKRNRKFVDSPLEEAGFELFLQGTSMGGNRFRVDMPRLLSLWRQGRLKLDHLISGKLKLDQINEGFAALKSGTPVRQLIDFAI